MSEEKKRAYRTSITFDQQSEPSLRRAMARDRAPLADTVNKAVRLYDAIGEQLEKGSKVLFLHEDGSADTLFII